MKRAILSFATIAALSFAFVLVATAPLRAVGGSRYGTLSPASTVIDAPPLVCTGYTIVTNTPSAASTNITVTTNGVWTATDSISEPTANRLGYKLVVDTPPVCPSGYHAVPTGWSETNRIYRVYDIEKDPPPPARRIYKYDLSAACIEYCEITNLVTFISADAGVKWMWDCAEILVEDDPYFISATNMVIQSGAISEAKVKAILDRAYQLGQLSTAN